MPSSALGYRRLPSFPTRRSSDLTAAEAASASSAMHHGRACALIETSYGRDTATPARRASSSSWQIFSSEVLIIAFASSISFWRACRSEEHTSELQSLRHLVCRLLRSATVVYPLSLHDALPI